MFAIIGEGQLPKEALMEMLINLGILEPQPIVKEIEKRGKVVINNMKIMYVR